MDEKIRERDMETCGIKRIIIAGGRDFYDFRKLFMNCFTITTQYSLDKYILQIISGGYKGADELGEEFAEHEGLEVIKFPANWDKYGKSAGPLRNIEMAENADILIAFWNGKSKGTKHMIDVALKKGLEVHVFRY